MRFEASALVRFGWNASSSWACSDSVLRYDVCAPVIGSSPDTHSSGGFSMLDGRSGTSLGLLDCGMDTHSLFAECSAQTTPIVAPQFPHKVPVYDRHQREFVRSQ